MTEPRSSVVWADRGDAPAVADCIAGVLARPGDKRIAVPGGSTPRRIFELLAARDLEWRGATLVLTDERQVPADHPASNFAKLATALGGTQARIAPLQAGDRVEPFDLVWLGMGEDGHVASLFPKMVVQGASLDQGNGPRVIATVPDPLPPGAPFARLSLNFEALVRAGQIILVVSGAGKRALLERVIAGSGEDLPVARLLRAARCPVTIYWS